MKNITLRQNKPSREPREKQAQLLDRCFVWLAKTGSIPGMTLLIVLLPFWAFLTGGLIYRYQAEGAYGSLGGLICLIIFAVALSKLTTLQTRFSVRTLGYVYLGVFVALLLTTLGLELWLFKTL